MRMRDAVDRVDREHPELTGDDRLQAIRALRQEDREERRRTRSAGQECPACHEMVRPDEPAVLAALSVLVVLLALASLVASVAAAAHTFGDSTVHGGWIVVLWPVAAVDGWAHSKLLAVLLAFAAAVATAWMSGKLGDRAKRRARCPKCGSRLSGAPQT